ncbi:HBA protein, partial [Polyodon spathula]|nr:hemoglobin subunit alpha-like [Polyodon spathula]MBN3283356.1 HBA protein [Polyodon spathula]
MPLTQVDKNHVKSIWSKASGKAEELGAQALGRMLQAFPNTRTYFSHYSDMSVKSSQVHVHGKKIIDAITEAVNHIDDISGAMSELSTLHAHTLRVDPANFKVLSHNILVVLALYFPADFTPEVHLSCDKFLSCVSYALAEKYR